MKSESAKSLSIAVVAFALLAPQFAQARSMESMTTSSPSIATSLAGHREAMRMVPARAALARTLDARKARSGLQFKATLSDKVHLKNGPELPSGTALIGTVATDDMHVAGTSKLALRFTKAELKTGKVVPIKATIVAVYPPDDDNIAGYPVAAGNQDPNTWNDGTLQVDQIGVLSGVDLHSKIASRNSGVLVSTKKDDVKLSSGSEIALAIAAR